MVENMLLLPSYSPRTIADIRSARPYKPESNQQVIARLARTYALSETEIRLLMACDEDHIDAFGRME